MVEPSASVTPKRGLRERLVAFMSSLRGAEFDVSQRDLWYKVESALRAIEPGFMGVSDLYPDGSEGMATAHAIYEVCPADEWKTMRRGYIMSADGAVTLNDQAEHIEPVTTYEVVTDAAAQPTAASAATPCSCGGQQAHAHAPEPTTLQEAPMREKVKNVIAASNGRFAESDGPSLEKLTDEQLDALNKPVEAAVETEPKAAAAQTEAEILAANPDIAAIVIEHRSRVAAEKATLVASLKACNVEGVTEEQLNAKPVEELRTMAAFAKVEAPADQSLRGVPRAAASAAPSYAPPNGWAKAAQA